MSRSGLATRCFNVTALATLAEAGESIVGSPGWGWSSAKGYLQNPSSILLTRQYGELVKMGVIVSTKVECIAPQDAGSIVGLLLVTDAAVVELKQKKRKHERASEMDDFDY